MLLTVATYAAAFAAATLLAAILDLLLSPLWVCARAFNTLAPLVALLTSAMSMCGAMISFIWAARLVGVPPTLLMFFLPWLGVMSNCFRRIAAARKGRTLTLGKLPDGCDQRLQVRVEYSYVAGDTVGLWVPFLVLGEVPVW